MASVTFPANLGGSGRTISDDADPNTGLANGGHRLRFVPALQGSVDMAQYVYKYAAKIDNAAENAQRSENARAYVEAYAGALKSNIETHYDKLATLKLDFGRGKYFADGGDLLTETTNPADLLTVERATPKWVFGPNGKLREVPPNTLARQWNPSTGEPEGVLIEESRTNLLTGSESAWGSWHHGGSSHFNERVSDGSVPWMGNVDVAFFGPQAGNSSFSTNVSYYNVGILDVGEYCLTGLFKYRDPNGLVGSPTMRSLHRAIGDSSGSGGSNVARLFGAGGWHGSSSSTGSGVFGEARIVECRPVGNDWYYYVERFEIVEAGQVQLRLFPYNGGGSFTGDGETGILRTRLQLEQGSTPSSYIPTTDSPVTRAADNVSRVLGEEFNPQAGTVFVSVDIRTLIQRSASYILSLDSDSTSDYLLIQYSNTGGEIRLSQSGDGAQISTSISGTKLTAVFTYDSSSVRLALNGVIVGTENQSVDMTQVTHVRIGALAALQTLVQGSFGAIRYFPRALSEAELIELTS